MAVSESYLAFVLGQLEGVRGVVTKRMFGGVGIYSDGVFFAVIDNDTLFFKVDDDAAAAIPSGGDVGLRPDAWQTGDGGLLSGAAQRARGRR